MITVLKRVVDSGARSAAPAQRIPAALMFAAQGAGVLSLHRRISRQRASLLADVAASNSSDWQQGQLATAATTEVGLG